MALQPRSFVLGFLSGAVLLVLGIGAVRLITPEPSITGTRNTWQRNGGNTARMAERLQMTEEELRSALESGKSIQDIAEERGIALPQGGPGFRRTGDAFPASASGRILPSSTGSSVSS